MTNYATAITARRKPLLTFVLEIEGLPTAYSNRDLPSNWYTTETPRLLAKDRPTSILNCFLVEGGDMPEPRIGGTELDFIAGRSGMTTATFSLVDKDGSIAALAGHRRKQACTLLTDVPASGTGYDQLVIEGDDAVTVAGETYIYCGRETLKVSSASLIEPVTLTLNTTDGRGQFRSQPTKHWGRQDEDGHPHASGNLVGDLVTAFPRHLADRKCWLRVGLDASNDSECTTAFIGTIREFAWGRAGRVLTLSLEDAQTRLMKPLFSDLATLWAPREGTTSQGICTAVDEDRDPQRFHLISGVVTEDFDLEEDDEFLGLVGDGDFMRVFRLSFQGFTDYGGEFIAMPHVVLPSGIASLPRPASEGIDLRFSADPAGERFKPIVLVSGDPSATLDPPGFMWPAKPIVTDYGTVQTDHALAILLMVLCTSPDGGNGDWDRLRPDWGLNIPADEVDINGVLRLAAANPRCRVRIPVTDVVPSAREWLDAVLRPFGWAVVLKANGQLGVTSLASPGPAEREAFASITFADIALDDQGQPQKMDGPSGTGEQRVTSINWTDSPFLRGGKLELRDSVTIQVADEADALATAGDVTPLEIEADGIYLQVDDLRSSSTKVGMGGLCRFLPSGAEPKPFDTIEAASQLAAALQSRYRGTPAIYGIRTTFRKSLISLGDFVRLTLPTLANPFTGLRDLTNVVGQVVKRQPNLLEGTIDFDIAVSDAGNEETRFMAPALDITNWDAGTGVAEVEEHSFTDDESDYPDNYAFLAGGAGDGDMVRIYSPDFAWRSQPLRVTTKTDSTHITLVDPLSATIELSPQKWSDTPRAPQADDIVRLADRGECTARQKIRFSFLTGPTGKFSDGTTNVYS